MLGIQHLSGAMIKVSAKLNTALRAEEFGDFSYLYFKLQRRNGRRDP